jgi:16S rRNA (cytidine1402-2'-O)-methyltransferase
VVEAGLHVVATPIGNLGDLTLRALETLTGCDLIACEDLRVTATLCRRHGITTRRIAYHEHNAERMRPLILRRLQEGARVALVSDAGTPLVSDPGFKLVRDVIEAALPLHTLPGPSALLAALVLSGLPSDRFLFAGFLDAKDLTALAAVPATLIFYEAPPRLAASLADMATALGDRPAAVARELTKLYEEVRRGTLKSLAQYYAEAGAPKGEIVVVVGPPLPAAEIDEAEIDRRLVEAMARESLRDAASEVAEALGLPRKRVYARALALTAA